MHCRRKSSFGRPEKLCGALTYCMAYTVRTPWKNSRLPGMQEGPSHSMRQADSKNCRNLFNATEPVRVRLQQLQISCPGEPTFRALFPFRLADALQFPLFPPLTSAPSSSLGRSIFFYLPYFFTLQTPPQPLLNHDRPSQTQFVRAARRDSCLHLDAAVNPSIAYLVFSIHFFPATDDFRGMIPK